MVKGKGREREATNKASYENYVQKLKVEQKGFPVNKDGNANIAEVARQCDFGRDRLYGQTKLGIQFRKDLKGIGLEGGPTKRVQDDYLAKKVDKKSRDASVLRTQLDAKVQEVSILRQENEQLKADLKKMKQRKSEHDAAMEEMENTGRRNFFG
jgi:hypothetical protein